MVGGEERLLAGSAVSEFGLVKSPADRFWRDDDVVSPLEFSGHLNS